MSGRKYHCLFVLVTLLWLAGISGRAVAGPYSNGITDGIAYNDPAIVGWATGCSGWRPNWATFGNWSDATGAAPAVSNDVVSLGDGGYAILSFDVVISDSEGPDLAVFENTLGVDSNVFAELGFVEVSSDGVNFVRFRSHSLTAGEVGAFGLIDPTNVNNLAGKHVNNTGVWLGTPFDLAELANEAEVLSGLVDLSNITHVKIIDVIGDGSTFDSYQNPIYDPYPTEFPSGGFDLDAVAIIDYAPEPTTCLMLSLAGLASLLRRRK
ncbi:MAG: PEP-CTERM sorting domain-containing protein [Actinobacteria bacterium]|nr:PEP-CTERM sorting domain-containing protein [Actinomycetota bacterium]